jgi:hypothetical protein
VLVLTGKTLGKEEIQVTVGEFVRSLTYGAVENVPIARNCPVPCKLPTARELGMISSERRLPALSGAELVTVRVAKELVAPLNAIPPAVIVVVPTPIAVATPEALMVATDGLLEVQVTPVVMFCVEGCFALP